MPNLLKRFLFAALLIASSPIHGFASPAKSRLLPLIPREAQIVAGIEDPRNPDKRGHLLLVTMRNTFDFDDWQSLTGVDTHRVVDETIWVDASSPQGELWEHALLVAGRFDREHIFHAAQQNGAPTSTYRGVEVLLVKPFTREERQMSDTRWMAILDCQTVVFGTPWLVQKVLDRYVDHEPVNPFLADRLARLHSQLNSWDLIAMPPELFSRHAAVSRLPTSCIDLLGVHIMEGANELTLGIHYGSSARVDFVVRTANDHQAPSGADEFARTHLFEATSFQGLRRRFENISIEDNLIQGSIVLPGKQLETCFESVSRDAVVARIRAAR
jgi:hypothetical protein